MRCVKILGVFMFLGSLSVVLAGGIGIPKREDVPKYLKQLKTSPVAADRARAAVMLGKRGGINANDVEDAIEPLKKSLQKDIDATVRAAAAQALGNIHSNAEGIVPILIDRLKNDSVMNVKMASVVALGQYGPNAKDAVPPLRDLLKKFDAKKSKEGQTIQNSLMAITGKKQKKG